MNTIAITGNVVAAPEKVKYGKGNILANMRIGNNELVKGESVSNGFFDVTVFGDQAKRILSLKKGERVVVVGRIQHQTYERPDGSKGGRTRLIAQAVGLSYEFDDAARSAGKSEKGKKKGKKSS